MTDLSQTPAPAAMPVVGAGAPAPAASLAMAIQEVTNAVVVITDAAAAAEAAAAGVASSPANLMAASLDNFSTALADVLSAAMDIGAAARDLVGHFQNPLAPVNAPAPVPAPAPVIATAPAPAAAASIVRMTGPWVAGTLYGVVPGAPLAAIPDSNEKWFAITRGKYVGLTRNSAISLNAVTGITSALSDKCNSQADALDHFNTALALGAIAVIA
ncbi:hypothetical protein FB451DRAFT_1183586 [Mycena latifolia]|nr:hypothetical protein FB451DRAFT_1183586 [Mycena latifolia]